MVQENLISIDDCYAALPPDLVAARVRVTPSTQVPGWSTLAPAGAAPAGAAGAAIPSADLTSPRIVLVDDDPLVRDVIAMYLRREQLRVEEFDRAFDAMRSLVQNRADLVITDLLMPDTDGMELLISIRRLTPRPKVIVISGGGVHMSASMVAARQLGAVATLWKPFDLAELLRVVRSALGTEAQAPAGRSS